MGLERKGNGVATYYFWKPKGKNSQSISSWSLEKEQPSSSSSYPLATLTHGKILGAANLSAPPTSKVAEAGMTWGGMIT